MGSPCYGGKKSEIETQKKDGTDKDHADMGIGVFNGEEGGGRKRFGMRGECPNLVFAWCWVRFFGVILLAITV